MDNYTANESLPICSSPLRILGAEVVTLLDASTISEDYLEIPNQLPNNIRLPDAINDEEDQTIISLSDISSIIGDVLEVDISAETTADSQNIDNKYSQQLCSMPKKSQVKPSSTEKKTAI